MFVPSILSVTEAASRLGVSRRRVLQLIKSGSLPARGVGSSWIIDERDLDRLDGRAHGRPVGPASAWAIAALLAGQGDWLSPVQRSRARSRVAGIGGIGDAEQLVSSWRSLLRQRARRLELSVAEADLGGVRDEERIVLSGLSLPSSGIAATDIVEGYVIDAELSQLCIDHLMVRADGPGVSSNVVLHIPEVAPRSWRRLVADPAIQAADLADHRHPRAQAAAAQILLDKVLPLAGAV